MRVGDSVREFADKGKKILTVLSVYKYTFLLWKNSNIEPNAVSALRELPT